MKMRVLHFRQWVEGKFYHWGIDLDGSSFAGPVSGGGTRADNTIHQQFTGLLDIDGIKVYEGDILEIWYPDSSRPNAKKYEQVVYRNGSACFDTPDVDDFNRAQIRVVGNIFETPEILVKCSNPNWIEPGEYRLVLHID